MEVGFINKLMKNIIFLLPNFYYGGAGKSTTTLCLNLNKRLYNISVISLGKNFYKKELLKNKINVYEVNSSKLIFAVFKIKNIITKICENKKKSILVSSIHYTNIISLIFYRYINNLKLIIIERTDLRELKIYQNLIQYIKNSIILVLAKKLYKKSDVIISNSKDGKKYIEKHCKTKVFNIPSPSLTEKLKPHFRKKSKPLKVLTVGRLSKEKGIETIILAMKNLNFKNFSLTIIGNGPEKNELKKLIKKLDLTKKVFLLGYKNNLKKYYKESNLYINASHFEGFCNSIVEAINYNNPIICTNCPGGNKEITLNGRGGEYFPINNYNILASKINQFYKNPSTLVKKLFEAKKNIKNYSVSNHVYKFDKIFKNL